MGVATVRLMGVVSLWLMGVVVNCFWGDWSIEVIIIGKIKIDWFYVCCWMGSELGKEFLLRMSTVSTISLNRCGTDRLWCETNNESCWLMSMSRGPCWREGMDQGKGSIGAYWLIDLFICVGCCLCCLCCLGRNWIEHNKEKGVSTSLAIAIYMPQNTRRI